MSNHSPPPLPPYPYLFVHSSSSPPPGWLYSFTSRFLPFLLQPLLFPLFTFPSCIVQFLLRFHTFLLSLLSFPLSLFPPLSHTPYCFSSFTFFVYLFFLSLYFNILQPSLFFIQIPFLLSLSFLVFISLFSPFSSLQLPSFFLCFFSQL